MIAGVVMLGWCALLLTDTTVSQWKARRSLEAILLAAAVGPPRLPAGAPPPPVNAPIVRPGSIIADLSIPRVALAAVVLHGSDDHTLRRGPGHLENTALPGEHGNVVIAGHRDSFFRRLRDVAVGDDIFMDTAETRLHYRVTSMRVVDGHDLSVLEQTGDAILTLITCYPFWVLGPAPDRFVVRAALVTTATPATVVVRPSPPDEPVTAPTRVPAANDRSLSKPPDDTALVRLAIERFRLTYNARLISHDDTRPSGPLAFHSCDVTLAENRAIAACATSPSLQPEDGDPWRIELERTGSGWAIRSILAN